MSEGGTIARWIYAGRILASPPGLTGGHLPITHAAERPWASVGLLGPDAPAPEIQARLHTWTESNGTAALELARSGGALLLTVPGEADFVLSPDGRRITIRPLDPLVDEATLSHLLLDQVLPRLLAHEGALVLHAAAVDTGAGVVLLVGGSGSGKSTLAAALSRSGAAVLSDDAVLLCEEGASLVAVPTYPGLRLHADSLESVGGGGGPTRPMARYSAKLRVDPPGGRGWKHHDGDPGPARVRRVVAAFLLDAPLEAPETGGVAVTRVSPAAACMLFVRDAFQLDVTDRERQARQFALAAAAAEGIPVFALAYSRAYEALSRVCAEVLRVSGAEP